MPPNGPKEVESEQTHEQSFRVVRAWQEQAFEVSAKEPRWRVELNHASRELERLFGLIVPDKDGILARFGATERAELEHSFERFGPLVRAASFVDRRGQRQGLRGLIKREAAAACALCLACAQQLIKPWAAPSELTAHRETRQKKQEEYMEVTNGCSGQRRVSPRSL